MVGSYLGLIKDGSYCGLISMAVTVSLSRCESRSVV